MVGPVAPAYFAPNRGQVYLDPFALQQASNLALFMRFGV
jgi:hypothetical protein